MLRLCYIHRIYYGLVKRLHWIAVFTFCGWLICQNPSTQHRKQLNKKSTLGRELYLFPEVKQQNKHVSPFPDTEAKTSLNSSCNKRGLVFLKTHKTGSTTLTNIILRYAEKHKLVVGLPLERHWELAGYPALFNRQLIVPHLPKYDVLCHHFRYHQQSVAKAVSGNALRITLLREPGDCFESGFAFFRDWPYPAWFTDPTDEKSLVEFVSDPTRYYNRSTPWHFRAKNYMAFDLGFDNERNDISYSNTIIQQMEKNFDLVLITERMDESLILLKDKLCMEDYQDIVYLRLKVRHNSSRRKLSAETKDKILQWNYLDKKLYDFFNKSLDKKISEYGTLRMKNELLIFRSHLEAAAKRCILYYDQFDMKPWISRIKLRDNAGAHCEQLTWGEVKYGDYLRKKQQKYSGEGRVHQPSYVELKRMLNEAQNAVIG